MCTLEQVEWNLSSFEVSLFQASALLAFFNSFHISELVVTNILGQALLAKEIYMEADKVHSTLR